MSGELLAVLLRERRGVAWTYTGLQVLNCLPQLSVLRFGLEKLGAHAGTGATRGDSALSVAHSKLPAADKAIAAAQSADAMQGHSEG